MKIALVLSGGGVLGAAHVGALEALDHTGIHPDFVVGTSAGAIIGSLYAAGGIAATNAFLDTLATTFSSPRAYLLSTPQKIFSFVERLLAEYVPRDYAKLAVPFYPVATNLRTGQRHTFTEGDPIAGVLASAAYPGVFAAQQVEGESYADGGLTASVPSFPARELGATTIIGSSIYLPTELTAEQVHHLNLFRIISRSLDIMQAELARDQMALCDFCFTPSVSDGYQWYNLKALPEIREAGRQYAGNRVAELRTHPKLARAIPR